jgi:peptide chain release factor 3
VQLFRPLLSKDYILGAVGLLQFEVIMARLRDEYGVDAVYEGADFAAARWVTCPDRKRLEQFQRELPTNVAVDAAGDLAYLAPSEWRLQYTMEQWPEIVFHKTCEHH